MVQVGDKFKITKSNFYGDKHTKGGIVTYVRKGHKDGFGEFRADSGLELTFAYEGNEDYPCRVVPVSGTTPKDPIEYLKSAHADGLMIDPATMLRECYGITKAERVVVEWSEAKREIKVGDRVRLLRGGDAAPLLGFTNGEVYKVKNITNCVHRGTRLELDSCGFTSPNDVELV